MQYETVTTEHKITQLNQAIANQETQHYQLVLESIANAANKAAVDHITSQMRIREQAIANLRAERDKQLAAQRADAEGREAQLRQAASGPVQPDQAEHDQADADQQPGQAAEVLHVGDGALDVGSS